MRNIGRPSRRCGGRSGSCTRISRAIGSSPSRRDDRISKLASTRCVGSGPASPASTACSRGCGAHRAALLRVLERPEVPLHTNLSEGHLRDYVKKRKISGGTRSESGRQARDTFASLKKTCRELGVNFWAYLQDRVRGVGQIPRLAELIRRKARRWRPGRPWPRRWHRRMAARWGERRSDQWAIRSAPSLARPPGARRLPAVIEKLRFRSLT